jgi:uncharacterized protein (TIGR03067 family)
MHRCLLLFALVSLAFAPAPLPKADGPSDAQKLQGTWERTHIYNGTLHLPEKPREVILRIKGEKAAFSRNGEEQTRWAIKLDAKTSPKGLDLVGLDDSKGFIQHGIFRLEGDTLTWCYSGTARPASFDRSAPGVFLMILKRMKP